MLSSAASSPIMCLALSNTRYLALERHIVVSRGAFVACQPGRSLSGVVVHTDTNIAVVSL